MRRRIVLIVAAVLLALAGTAALWQYVSGADARALAGKEAVDVLVAADAIPAGMDFEEAQRQGLVETVGFPRGAVPVGAFAEAGQAAGLVTSRAIEPHELLLTTNLGPRDAVAPTTGGLTVPPGKVAIPVSLKHFANSADWAGYLEPGAEIAIFATFTSVGPADAPAFPNGKGLDLDLPQNNNVSRLVVHRATVLAVAGSEDAESETPGTAIVLAVDQQQSEQIVLGLFNGVALYPVLLTDDEILTPSPGTPNAELFDLPGTAP
jgi:pilus assembly protein CpaB